MRKVIGRVKSFVIDEYPRRKTLKPMEKENLGVKNPMKWNISVIGGKEFKRDFVSSGERKRKRWRRLVEVIQLRIAGPSDDVGCKGLDRN